MPGNTPPPARRAGVSGICIEHLLLHAALVERLRAHGVSVTSGTTNDAELAARRRLGVDAINGPAGRDRAGSSRCSPGPPESESGRLSGRRPKTTRSRVPVDLQLVNDLSIIQADEAAEAAQPFRRKAPGVPSQTRAAGLQHDLTARRQHIASAGCSATGSVIGCRIHKHNATQSARRGHGRPRARCSSSQAPRSALAALRTEERRPVGVCRIRGLVRKPDRSTASPAPADRSGHADTNPPYTPRSSAFGF